MCKSQIVLCLNIVHTRKQIIRGKLNQLKLDMHCPPSIEQQMTRVSLIVNLWWESKADDTRQNNMILFTGTQKQRKMFLALAVRDLKIKVWLWYRSYLCLIARDGQHTSDQSDQTFLHQPFPIPVVTVESNKNVNIWEIPYLNSPINICFQYQHFSLEAKSDSDIVCMYELKFWLHL